MRKFVLAAAFVVTLPALAGAAPCLSGTLASYIGASSCEIGAATFSGFDALAPLFPGASPIDPAAILVEPFASGVGLDFVLNQSAALGELKEVLIRYLISGFFFDSATLAMTGASVVGFGSVSATLDICGDGTYSGSVPHPGDCSSGKVTTLAVIQFDGGSTSPDTKPVDPMSADIFVDIVIDNLPGDQAALDGRVRNAFAAAPEPSVVLLLVPALAALARRRTHRGR
jgi:hypothetical protein